MLQLRFVFVRHSDVFVLRHNYVIYLFDVITFFHDVRILKLTFNINILVSSNYVRKSRCKMVIF